MQYTLILSAKAVSTETYWDQLLLTPLTSRFYSTCDKVCHSSLDEPRFHCLSTPPYCHQRKGEIVGNYYAGMGAQCDLSSEPEQEQPLIGQIQQSCFVGIRVMHPY